MTAEPVYVVGVGMTPFRRPNSYKWDYPDMARAAGLQAIGDCGLDYVRDVQAAVCSYCYGEPTSGQRAVYELGHSGIPIFNVNNNCSSGSSGLQLARYLLQSNNFDCVLALGFEKMERGLSKKFDDRQDPAERHFRRIEQLSNGGKTLQPLPGMNRMTSEVIRMFALAAREYVDRFPVCTNTHFANIAYKNRHHGVNNPNACFYKIPPPSFDKIEHSRMLCPPITVHQSSMTADGSAAAIVCSRRFLERLPPVARRRAVPILAQNMVTDLPSSFMGTYAHVCGFDMSQKAADLCYSATGLTPSKINVAEVHDCFAPNEMLMYEAMRFASPGQAAPFLDSGTWISNEKGGRVYRCGGVVVNPSGGLESKGHPIGATGLGQCFELVTQLRGEAHARQVPSSTIALQHNFGIGGAAVVTLYAAPITTARL